MSAALVATAALSSAPALAQDLTASGAVILLQGKENKTVATAEYNWQIGDFSGYGFVDKNLDGSGHFTNHEVRANVVGPTFVVVEVGHHPRGGFQLVGAGVKLGNLPGISDGFRFLNVSAEKAFGANADQLKVVWRTKDLRISRDVMAYSNGFARFRKGAPDVIQPQGWMRIKGLPFEVGGELDVFGQNKNMQVAVKLNF